MTIENCCILKFRFKYHMKGLEVSYFLDYDYGETANVKIYKQNSDGIVSSNKNISSDVVMTLQSIVLNYKVNEWNNIPVSKEKSLIRCSLILNYDNCETIRYSNVSGGIIPPHFMSFINDLSVLLDNAEDLTETSCL